jgi:hypothetical protein
MKMVVTHLNYGIKSNIFSESTFITGTVCGLENKLSTDGTNSTSEHSEVTCKKCLRIMQDQKHWRHKKYITNNIGMG